MGSGYTVMSSKGHVRDLLKSSLSVDVEHAFEPTYRVLNDKRAVVKELKAAVQAADEIFLATDPDREGEAIAWHLIAAAEMPADAVKRVVFHEITDRAIADAFAHPRKINSDLVNAQQARRILDRLVGYKVTKLLQDKIRWGLTAGRVQSIALRLVVEREKRIDAFVAQEYWTIESLLNKQHLNGASGGFKARLFEIDGRKLALNGSDVKSGKHLVLQSAAEVEPHLALLQKSRFTVAAVKHGTRQSKPAPPFITSTLQQEASQRLHFNARRTMQIAQQLYEGLDIGAGNAGGLITYMRTDSVQVSQQAQSEARRFIGKTYGADYMPAKPPKYKTRAKAAQEAHEAIRPTSVLHSPAAVKAHLNKDQFRLYELIWQRFVASQMSNAVYDTIRIEIEAVPPEATPPYLFRATGSNLKFRGHLAVYEKMPTDAGSSANEDSAADAGKAQRFPHLEPGEALDLQKLLDLQHFTQPPPRYTEATLVRALEEHGIGRPSTYAPTVTLIQSSKRNYVKREGRNLHPTPTGRTISDLLSEYFTEEMDYAFTARMEEQLDDISEGASEWQPVLGEFYAPFEERLHIAQAQMPKQEVNEPIGRGCPKCETGDLIIKYGRWGKFIACNNYPDCRHTEPFLEKTGHLCPQCGTAEGGEIIEKRSRKNRLFYSCSRYPDCDFSAWKLPKDLTKTPAAAPADSTPVPG